jgi:hypothetical protein
MPYNLIVCRSLTYAQKAAAALERSGIPAHIMRTPTEFSTGGCSYSVKIPQKRRIDAKETLRRIGITPVRVLQSDGDGSYREVST